MKSYRVTVQMEATEQYFPVVLFVMLSNYSLCERNPMVSPFK